MIRRLIFAGLLAGPAMLLAQTFTDIAPANNINRGFGVGNLGGGVSMCDFNGDGWDDLTFCTGLGENLLFYENNNGSFQQIVAPISNTGESKEVIWVDYDNDGDKDLYVTTRNSGNRLYRRTGSNFTDVTNTAFGGPGTDDSFGADWADINHDGWLDLYLCLYSGGSSDPANRLYLNNGNGTFTNIASGQAVSDGHKLSFDASFLDYNRDGWPDLYVINDRYNFTNGLYLNNGNSTFTDASASSGTGVAINAMNAGSGDFNNDGWPDIYVTNTPEGNVLFSNNGDGTFWDATSSAGVSFNRIGWAASFCDFDNDMDQDLYVSCMSQSDPGSPNAMYINQGNGTFTEPLRNSMGLGGNDYGNSFSHATGDFNNDGKIDIASNQMLGSNFQLWQNDMSNTGNWIKVNLYGVSSNTDGIGAWIEVWTAGIMQNRYSHCSMGYLGQHSNNYAFGLGTHTSVDSIIVAWPSGVRDKLIDLIDINDVVYVTEGDFALPVRLLDFRLQSSNTNRVQLNWSTAEEFNTKQFEIERSLDARNFRRIGTVNATGFSERVQQYDFVDAISGGYTVYYRLKIMDFDGSFEYSPIRSIRKDLSALNQEAFLLRSQPQNPVLDQLIQVSLTTNQAGKMRASLLTRAGVVLKTEQKDLALGNHDWTIDAGDLPTGVYFLRLEMNGLVHGLQLLLQ